MIEHKRVILIQTHELKKMVLILGF